MSQDSSLKKRTRQRADRLDAELIVTVVSSCATVSAAKVLVA
jgi:hypothetical protein